METRPRRCARALVLALWATSTAAWADGAVEGQLSLAIEGLALADVGPIVVYLEPVSGRGEAVAEAPAVFEIRQHNASFTPGFLAVSARQTIDMPNDDDIYHNVFSYSKGNAFDLGLYPAGSSRQVTFENPGVIKIYCSIHESMNATVFVAPTPHFAVVAADGRFALRRVPAGPWRLRSWCERLPDSALDVVVEEEAVTRVGVSLGGPSHESSPARP